MTAGRSVAAPNPAAEATHALMHVLQGGLYTYYEDDGDYPRFRRIVSPTRKFTGDNADAIYYDAPISGDREYIVRGSMDGAVYMSITLEGCPSAEARLIRRPSPSR